jgi:hypothetical protein
VRHVAHTIEVGEVHKKLWLESLKERDHLKDIGIDGRILCRYVCASFIHSFDLNYSVWKICICP